MKIKITEPGFENLTGDFGGIQFEGGVSVPDLSESDVYRLGSAIRVEVVGGGAVTAADKFTKSQDTRAPVQKKVEKAPEPEQTEEQPEAEDEPKDRYTEEQLAAIADEKGIAGLREIAQEFGVRGNSIKGLIKSILDKQG